MGVILAVLAALEGLLERLRLVLGRLEGILDRLGGILGVSWRSGRPLGSVLGAILASSGAILGVSGASWAQKSYKKWKQSMSRGLLIDFGSFLCPRERNLIAKIVGFPVPDGFSPFLTGI